ncbi:MAG: glutamate decarboxylase [Solirubrobacterales bacterium]|nr:glutamate decarboxylase [Solirubrobacterales bacterium]MBV9167133.1 glutamate decarboxylase [Solirubrobacterales bacterium]MBV9536523.1 glutamate decarboxylase [Solirubrobacterales bacterium]
MSVDTTDVGDDTTALVREQAVRDLPHDALAEHGCGGEVAFNLLSNELLLDGSARLNLATFVTTWMPPRAEALMGLTADKNMIDKDEYPQTAEIERRCVNIIGRLWHAPGTGDVTGTSTTGSSEAAMLGGLALKWRWRERMKVGGKPTDRPNLVTGVNVQVCWEKFCRYWDVEPRLVPMEGDRYHLSAEGAAALCDENTIGVVAVLGSTFDGSYEPIGEICAALDELAARGGPDVPVHVDAASGGFIAPFVQPDLVWDFRLPRVQSINASGHKYGLVYPGVGWAIWRERNALPSDLVFNVNYLGGSMPTFALNFSRPGSEVIAQYYMFVSLGAEGYRRVQRGSSAVAQHIAREIAGMGPYRLLTDGGDLPVFAFTLAPEVANYTVFDVSARLREQGWLVPAYTFPENRQDLSVLRVVVRAGMSRDMADLFLDGVRKQTASLEGLKTPLPKRPDDEVSAFKH